MCTVCGCPGPKRCSRCHKATYCSKDHQTLDWKAGHKQLCNSDGQSSVTGEPVKKEMESSCTDLLFPEFEIVTEPEGESAEADEVEKSETDKMKEYEELVKKTDGELYNF